MKGIYKITNNITGEIIECYSLDSYEQLIADIENNFQEITHKTEEETTIEYKAHKISTTRYFENGVYNIRTYID